MAKNKNIASLDSTFLNTLVGGVVGNSIRETFAHLLVESEKEKQGKISDKIDKLDLRAETEENAEVQDEQEDAVEEKPEDTSSPKVKAQKLPSAMQPEDIAKMLNIIRAGKSLKDPEVKERFDIWWDSLSPPEKIALKGFLDGIAQIITGDTKAEDASKPGSEPYNVQMTSAPKEKPRRIQNKNVEKSAEKSSIPAGTNTPIVVGEINSIHAIKKRMIS
tara:strand:- start:1786 stop:2442 length:657 start_codon:yes stop_codon:yes gene_type:complete